jgi:hypothetical protein
MTEDESWHSWSSNPTIPDGTTVVRMYVRSSRSTSAGDNHQVNGECADVTLTIDGPTVTSSSEIDNYSLNCTITNEETGVSFSVEADMEVDETITIDTQTRTVTLSTGSTLTAVTGDEDEDHWLYLIDGENVIKYEETGASEVEVDIYWDRRLFW